MKFRSGFVSIVGRPNVGKSTLLNAMVGEKLSIITDKPQTTRNRITGVRTDVDSQIVFIDTPGIHKPKHRLGETMVKTAFDTFGEVDMVLFLVDIADGVGTGDLFVAEQLKKVRTKKVLILNKTDKIDTEKYLANYGKIEQLGVFDEIFAMSALNEKSVQKLVDYIKGYLTEGPMYYPAGMVTDQPEKAIIAEIIREKALLYLDQEIPHGIAVEIESLSERQDKDLIDVGAVIVTEKKSHKGIIIGKGGRKLKGIGKAARLDIENLFDAKVNLQIWVKVKEGWRDSDSFIKNYGFKE